MQFMKLHHKSSILLYLAIISILTITILGCGKAVKKSGKITLDLGMWSSSPPANKLVQDQIDAFEKKYPKIKVIKQISVGGNFNEWLQINVAGGTAPNISFINSMIVQDYIGFGALKPLTKYYTKEELKAYYPNLLKGFKANGIVYGIPKDFNTLVMYYNKDMFEAAGIPHPPRTWKELEETLEKLQTAGKQGKLGKNFKFPMSTLMQWNRFNPFVLQNGGRTYKDGKLLFNSPEACEALDWFMSLVKKGYIVVPTRMGNQSLGAVLGSGFTAIMFSGGWQVPYLRQAAPNLNYGMAELPMNKKKGSMLYTVCYSILNVADYPEESAKLLKFMTGPEAEKLTAKAGQAIPSRIEESKLFMKLYPEQKALATSANFSVVYCWGKGSHRIDKELNYVLLEMYINYTQGDKSLKAKPLLDAKMQSLKYAQ